MTSICSSNNYQHFQLSNGNIMLQQQQQQFALLQQQQQQQQQQHQLLAPKPLPLGNSQLQNMQHVAGQLKKYYNNNLPHFGGSNDSSDPQVTPSVQRRNARERNRVKQVNNGFVNLRQHLPQTVINTLSHGGRGASKKLSKVDTLRIAVEYIRGLQDMLEGQESTRRLFTTGGGGGGNSSSDESSSNSSYQDQDQDYTHYQAPHSYHSASPTPSYSDSDLSGSYVKQEQEEEQQQLPLQQQFKFESFDSFSDEQPDDEELLDYISSWQEQ